MSSLFPAQQVANVPGNLGAGAGLSFAGGANAPSHQGDFTSSFNSFQQEDHPGKRTNEVSSVPIQVLCRPVLLLQTCLCADRCGRSKKGMSGT